MFSTCLVTQLKTWLRELWAWLGGEVRLRRGVEMRNDIIYYGCYMAWPLLLIFLLLLFFFFKSFFYNYTNSLPFDLILTTTMAPIEAPIEAPIAAIEAYWGHWCHWGHACHGPMALHLGLHKITVSPFPLWKPCMTPKPWGIPYGFGLWISWICTLSKNGQKRKSAVFRLNPLSPSKYTPV